MQCNILQLTEIALMLSSSAAFAGQARAAKTAADTDDHRIVGVGGW